MSFRIDLNKSAEANAKQVASEQINSAIQEIDDPELPREDAVHQIRKHCKKIRGLLRLVRPMLGKKYAIENVWYRDIARLVADLRDGSVSIGTYEDVAHKFKKQLTLSSYETIGKGLRNLQSQIVKETDVEESLAVVKTQFLVGRERLSDWSFEHRGFQAYKVGFLQVYSRAEKEMKVASDSVSTATMHQWRKYAKYHWYHCRLLQSVWPAVMKARRDELQVLTELLGDSNDLSVLESILNNHRDDINSDHDVNLFLGLLEKRRHSLYEKAFKLGKKLFAESGKSLIKRIEKYWSVAKSSV